jgi:3-dehydroquinate synthetase
MDPASLARSVRESVLSSSFSSSSSSSSSSGAAVSAPDSLRGLLAALRVSADLGHASGTDVHRMARLLERAGLDTAWPALEGSEVARWLAADKKTDGEAVRFVVAGAPGRVQALVVPRGEVLRSVSSFPV